MLSVCCLLIAFDIFMLYSSKDINISTIMIMAITDAVFITAAVCLFPFTVKFRGIKMTKSEKQKLRNTKK